MEEDPATSWSTGDTFKWTDVNQSIPQRPVMFFSRLSSFSVDELTLKAISCGDFFKVIYIDFSLL